jgi:nucleoside-diphosphate-sugar epimerase
LNKTIGIIGCGWLGLPLAKALLAENYAVHGSTTTEDRMACLKKAGIHPYKIVLGEAVIIGPISDFLSSLDILIINVPPKLRGASRENYTQKMKLLHNEINYSDLRKVIFVSSTSVYGDLEGEVTEDSKTRPVTESGKQLKRAENIFRTDPRLQCAVIRFGGLIGPERHPVTHLAGKTGLENGDDYINLIHLNDCIGIIKNILDNNYWNETFNGVFPDHPKKKKYYTIQAKKRGLPAPEYVVKKAKNKGKQINSRNILNKNYYFSTPISD